MKKSSLEEATETDGGTQYGALCYRERKGVIQFLMITSRRTKRWVIPKGWSIEGLSPADSAAQEAWEEAGVRGTVDSKDIGLYSYIKEGEKGAPDVPCTTWVYPLRVTTLKGDYPEKSERRRKWMGRKKAADAVWEPELAKLIRRFEPADDIGA